MKPRNVVLGILFVAGTVAALAGQAYSADNGFASRNAKLLEAEREPLLRDIRAAHGYSDEQIDNLRKILASSPRTGQGTPEVTRHPVSGEQCRAMLKSEGIRYESEANRAACGGRPYMVPISDKVCIDQFEFPNIPCDFPVTWITTRNAALACEAVGKRLCDAHEWEGACAGRVDEQELAKDLAVYKATGSRDSMRSAHNSKRERVFALPDDVAPADRYDVCGFKAPKNPTCVASEYTNCGTNTYPSGYFPRCRGKLPVYDIIGNAAEHMNLPLTESQLGSRGGHGMMEMKGSWFTFSRSFTVESTKQYDDCRWRAPDWHGPANILSGNTHANYHLGFRCCADRK